MKPVQGVTHSSAAAYEERRWEKRKQAKAEIAALLALACISGWSSGEGKLQSELRARSAWAW